MFTAFSQPCPCGASACAVPLHADSQRRVLLSLGDFTCAHNVHGHPDADDTPHLHLQSSPSPVESSRPLWPHHSPHSTWMSPNRLKSVCFQPKPIPSLSQTSFSPWISHSGADITIHPVSQTKSVASGPPSPSLSINKSVSSCERNRLLFVAWVTAVAPQWSPGSPSLVNVLSHRCCTDQFPASNGFPSPAGSSSNSDACRTNLSRTDPISSSLLLPPSTTTSKPGNRLFVLRGDKDRQ